MRVGLRPQPNGDSQFELADWFELQLVSGEAWRVTEANAYAFLDQVGLVDAFGHAVPGAVLAMKRRAKRLGDAYFLDLAAGGLRKRSLWGAAADLYIAFAALTNIDFDEDVASLGECASLFEQLCAEVFGTLGGATAHVVHFGYPSRSGRPQGFPDAIRWLANKRPRGLFCHRLAALL